MSVKESSVQVFNDNWQIYVKVVMCDYMHHTKFASFISSAFDNLKQKGSHVLDIGCGDASMVLPYLLSYKKINYTGYDLSPHTLQIATKNLASVPGSVRLKEGDMLTLLQQETENFDLIISSFSIHHLQDDDKKQLLENCYQRLKPGGVMLYTDVFITNQVNRDDYLAGYSSYINSEWTLLDESEKQPVVEHIRQFDFPSKLENTVTDCTAIGFYVSELSRPDKFHVMLRLQK